MNSSHPHYVVGYRKLVAELLASAPKAEAMSLAVGGGSFEGIGMLCRDLLLHFGLQENMSLVDVGCGSGRLAYALREMNLKYFGIDIIPELISYAREICKRSDWDFKLSADLTLPAADCSADFVTFFSVFTHLRHEESFVYLKEAKRILKPAGKIVFSFWDFLQPLHWNVFEHYVELARHGQPSHVLTQFIDAAGLAVWAKHAGLVIKDIYPGSTYKFPLSQDIINDSQVLSGEASFGQSICVMQHQ